MPGGPVPPQHTRKAGARAPVPRRLRLTLRVAGPSAQPQAASLQGPPTSGVSTRVNGALDLGLEPPGVPRVGWL